MTFNKRKVSETFTAEFFCALKLKCWNSTPQPVTEE